MAKKPKKLCSFPGCQNLSSNGRCEQHAGDTHDKYRRNSNERGYTYAWAKYRLRFLNRNPLCVHCLRDSVYTTATVVDHVIAHKGNKELFWEKSNHQSLCASCHNRKTASYDMGSW